MLYDMIGVDLRGQDAATVVIAVGIGDINLAFGKHAMISADCDEWG
jgi:hypothetical protein